MHAAMLVQSKSSDAKAQTDLAMTNWRRRERWRCQSL